MPNALGSNGIPIQKAKQTRPARLWFSRGANDPAFLFRSKSSFNQEASGRLTREPTPTQEVWVKARHLIWEPGRAIEGRLRPTTPNHSGNPKPSRG